MSRFVLTSQEKRVLIFIAAAFLLGLGAKCYRLSHPATAPAIRQPGATGTVHKNRG